MNFIFVGCVLYFAYRMIRWAQRQDHEEKREKFDNMSEIKDFLRRR